MHRFTPGPFPTSSGLGHLLQQEQESGNGSKERGAK